MQADLVTNQTLQLEDPTIDNATVCGSWQAMATEWWTSQAKGLKTEKPQTLRRNKSYKWLCSTEHMLGCGLGRGWTAFSVPQGDDEKEESYDNWPTITVAIDQGSDGWCAMMFLLYFMKLLVMCIPDPSHRCWNDCELALHDTDLWKLCILGVVLLGVDQGAWGNAKWFNEAREGVDEYMQLANLNCPLFDFYFKWILVETCQMHRFGEAGLAQEVFSNLPECVRRQMPKVGMSRCHLFDKCNSSFVVQLFV